MEESLEQFLKTKTVWVSVYPLFKKKHIVSVEALRSLSIEDIMACDVPSFAAKPIYDAVHGNTVSSNNNALVPLQQQLQLVPYEIEKLKMQLQSERDKMQGELQLEITKLRYENEKMHLLNKLEAEKEGRANDEKLADVKTEFARLEERYKSQKELLEQKNKDNEERLRQAIEMNRPPWAWWNSGWGPWGNTLPVYCIHGRPWAHCSTGPPLYCKHGNNWGTHCYQP